MNARRTTFTARASLLDRLVDEAPRTQREARPLRTQSRRQLMASVMRDLSWLLNSRTSHPPEEFDRRELTVIDYGIPDFGSYSPANPDDQRLLASRLARAIAFFEPRLKNVSVRVAPAMPNERSLQVAVDAELVVDEVREPVSFLTLLQKKAGTWEVHENR